MSETTRERAIKELHQWRRQIANCIVWAAPAPVTTSEMVDRLAALFAPPEPSGEASGYWWCPECCEEVDASRVTHQEMHDYCGRHVVWKEPSEPEPTYPCIRCCRLRTAAEGGTTFTVCDKCWDELHGRREPDVGEGVREQIAALILAGRLWCDRCESYDHECGCTPDVAERCRAEAVDRILALLRIPSGEGALDRLRAIHSALDDALGDTDVDWYEDDEEVRENEPVQWAAMKLAQLMDRLAARRSEGGEDVA